MLRPNPLPQRRGSSRGHGNRPQRHRRKSQSTPVGERGPPSGWSPLGVGPRRASDSYGKNGEIQLPFTVRRPFSGAKLKSSAPVGKALGTAAEKTWSRVLVPYALGDWTAETSNAPPPGVPGQKRPKPLPLIKAKSSGRRCEKGPTRRYTTRVPSDICRNSSALPGSIVQRVVSCT